MKKRWLAIAIAMVLALTPMLSVSAADLGEDLDGAKVTFENCRLTEGDVHGWEGLDPSLVTYNEGEMNVTAPAGVVGMYYRPYSPYGANGPFGEGGITMKLKLNYVEGAADWSVMLMIRNVNHQPSWSATNGLYMLLYPNQVVLYHVGTANPLAVLYKPVACGTYCNVEFITDDLGDGTTNVYVLFTDENGNLIQNDGDTSKYSMMAEGIPTESIPAAFISFYTNSGALASYSMKQGEWTFNASTEPEVTEPEVTEPEVTEPEVTEPEATEPAPAVPYPDLTGVSKYDFTELGVTTEGNLDKYWAPIGGGSYTINDAKNLVTVTPAATEGFYYGPCSPYGGALVKNVAIALTLGVDFKEGVADFGYMLILKGNDAVPTWGLTRGIVMMVYPGQIALCKVENAAPVPLAVYYGDLESGKNYNVEFIAIDREDGTTDAYLIITDENGKVLSNVEGANVTLSATGITGAAGEGYVTMFSNGGAVSQYRFGTGKFTDVSAKTGSNDVLMVVGMLMISACAAVCVALTMKRKAI